MPLRALRLALLLLFVASAAPAQDVVREPGARAATTVIIVRHAEKADVPGADPPLSAVGEARAQALRDALRDAGVEAVVVTQLQRTQLTAAPLALHLGVAPDVVETGRDVADHARRVAALVRERHAGRTVLVVGHSNTVPAIIAALGGGEVPPIADDEYAGVYVLMIDGSGAVRQIVLRYGAGN